jgi:hypothetical protein
MKALLKTFLALPGKMKPKRIHWNPRITETSSTRPYYGVIKSANGTAILKTI